MNPSQGHKNENIQNQKEIINVRTLGIGKIVKNIKIENTIKAAINTLGMRVSLTIDYPNGTPG